jgi:GNAT superfamily N-acetyltransferase
MKTLKKVTFKDNLVYQTRAGRDRISVADAKDAIWFQFVDGDDVLGICSMLPLPRNGGRVKAVWVKPEHRGVGNGTEMIEQLLQFARDAGADRLEVIAYNPKFYEARGFKPVGNPRPNGAQRLVKEPV